VNRVIFHVLDCILKTPSLFFNEKDDSGRPLPIPSRNNFRIFIQNVLKNFNIFKNNLGFHKQIGRLAMGSFLSGLQSNIFIHLMEQTVVSKLIKDETIVHWQRFADDVLCICKKGAVNTVLNKINGWDAKLTFKVEHLVNNENNLALKNRTIKFRKLFKKGEDTFFTNFQLSISPYK
jgi:hypothetical protein